MQSIGFGYKRDGDDFAHSAGIFILTPDGIVSQYFTGVLFTAWDVRLALVEASEGKIGSFIDHALLYCFRFDPSKGKYTWAVVNLLRLGGGLTILAIAALIFFMRKKEQRLPGAVVG